MPTFLIENRGPKHKSLKERFEHYVVRITETTCWIWGGAINSGGYGVIYAGNSDQKSVQRLAHRVAYELYQGPIPDGLELDHVCRERTCVNPQHLEPVTRDENQRRSPLTMATKYGERTHCPAGHLLRDQTRGKWRICRICRAEYLRKRKVA